MKRSIHGRGLVKYEGKVLGVSLGYDFCSEHEFGGIQDIQQAFGLSANNEKFWFEARKITKLPNNLHYGESKGGHYLLYAPHLQAWGMKDGRFVRLPFRDEAAKEVIGEYLENRLYFSSGTRDMATGRDSGSFGVHARKGQLTG